MPAKEYDTLVVLGGGVSQSGELPKSVKDRVRLAVEYFKTQKIGAVIMSGGYSYDENRPPAKTEARAMKELAVSLGLPAENIFTEEKSRETIENAYFTKVKFLIPRHWRKILVLLAPNHSKERVKRTLEKVWGPDYSFELADTKQSDNPLALEHEKTAMQNLREWLANVKNGDHEAAYAITKAKH